MTAPEAQQGLLCYWSLWERLKGGQAVVLSHQGNTFTLWFEGPTLGKNNALVAQRDSDLSTRRFGPGYTSEGVANCLNHLEKGWDSKQVPIFRPYTEDKNEKEEDFCDTRKRD